MGHLIGDQSPTIKGQQSLGKPKVLEKVVGSVIPLPMIQKLPVKHLGGRCPHSNQFFQRYARSGQHPFYKVPPKDVEMEDPQVREQEVALKDIGKVLTKFILVLSFEGVIETADCYAP